MAEQIKFGDRLFLRGEKTIFDNGVNDAIIEARNGTLEIRGNLVVTGTTTTVNSEQTSFADPYIVLNGDFSGSASEDVGLEINRGDDPNVFLTWDETTDQWSLHDKDLKTTGELYATHYYGNVTGNIISENGIIIVDVAGDGSVDINAGNIDGTVIGAFASAAGTFTTITGDGTDITNVLTNYTTDDLVEGVNNLYYTDERVDDRFAVLFDAGYGIQSTYDDALDTYLVNFDAINIGLGTQIYDNTDTQIAQFRTITVGDATNGGNGDLSISVANNSIIVDTAVKINNLQFNTFTGTGSVSLYTLPYNVALDWHILVYIDGVVQEPTTAYTVSGTTLTLSSPLPLNATMNVIKLASNNVATSITDADTLNGQSGSYYLDYLNLQNAPVLSAVATTGSYSDLLGTPAIPTNVSQLSNDAGYITSGDIPTNHMVNDATNTVSGSINPSVDATYDLGTATEQWNVIYGHTVEATYADLAERYAADAPYSPGTVLVFGGEAEVTTTTIEADSRVIGVVSTAPAYLMNMKAGNNETHPAIALKGRVPCKVIGKIEKGDLLVSSSVPGYAMSISDRGDAPRGAVIGKAIESKSGVGEGIIEIFVSMM